MSRTLVIFLRMAISKSSSLSLEDEPNSETCYNLTGHGTSSSSSSHEFEANLYCMRFCLKNLKIKKSTNKKLKGKQKENRTLVDFLEV